MGRKILTIILAAAFMASLIWAAVDLNSDLIRTGGRCFRNPDISARR